ncbi:MAG TPA: excinuclease ABC subunit UvrC [Candidatus Pullichristensenella excrementigallinarum]|uniref:UvrABC system protein C n=1 Tax=Candidatus Pullichristensenella excrementigallinarum TaxID=2840907 RepID=A0A9D1I9V0_9FIRM|nr:excinuclease ABC subunit UvrC [Candidatus Pullichristensenella excrementigallinarum]
MRSEEFDLKLKNLPDSPGCYLMKSQGQVIYVGKAKNLKNRVRQYFQSSRGHTPKVLAMVERVDDFDIVLVDGELEALALELNLIKRYKPKYNILLKDDKHFPYIRIDPREDFPRVELVRRQTNDGAKYFGPYQGATAVREVLDVVRMVFPIRTCKRAIRPDKPERPCVHHQVGQCLAPCAGLVSREEYHALLDRVMEFLRGHEQPVLRELRERMMQASRELNYERAAVYRDRIQAVEAVMQKQKAISTSPNDQDAIAVVPEGPDAVVEMLFVRSGRLIGSENYILEGAGADAPGEALSQFMLQYYDSENIPPHEILLSADPPERDVLEQLLSELHGKRTYILAPRRGDKRNLTRMAEKNARDLAEKRRKKLSRSRERTLGALEELQAALGLPALPRRIEGYDISNTQGALSVGSMVVMVDGISAKKEYRHFRIKTVEGANDFASMHEVLTRRLSHGLRERESGEKGRFSTFPDLILIDGGRGQLNAAQDAMHGLGLDIPMFGLAKRIEEIVLPDREDSLLLDRRSNALQLLQRLRDEAHRFAITHHRALRGRHSVSSQLDSIPGVGEKRRRAILLRFKTVEALKNASTEEIAQAVPKKVAEAVYRFLHSDD